LFNGEAMGADVHPLVPVAVKLRGGGLDLTPETIPFSEAVALTTTSRIFSEKKRLDVFTVDQTFSSM